LLASVLTFTSSPLWAQTSVGDYDVHHRGSVIGDDVLYSIGGGRAVSMGGAGNMQSIGVGIGWNSNLICGPRTSLGRCAVGKQPLACLCPDFHEQPAVGTDQCR